MANYLDEARLEELWGLIKEQDEAAIDAAVSAAARIETGSFSGTNSAVTLTFSFAPKMVVLEGYDHSNATYFKNTFVVATSYGSSKRIGFKCEGVSSAGFFYPTITFSGNTVSIDKNSNITNSGFTFGYVAFA